MAKITFWAYNASSEDAGRFAGFCRTVGTPCACHDDCVVLDVAVFQTWNEARRHANYLGDFGSDDGCVYPDELLQEVTLW